MKISAFTAVINERGIMLGRADQHEAGYTPLPELGIFQRYDEATKKADQLNRALGLSDAEALEIVATTIRAQNQRDHARKMEKALRVIIDAFTEAEKAGVQGIIYADALHPEDDDKTLLDYLRETVG